MTKDLDRALIQGQVMTCKTFQWMLFPFAVVFLALGAFETIKVYGFNANAYEVEAKVSSVIVTKSRNSTNYKHLVRFVDHLGETQYAQVNNIVDGVSVNSGDLVSIEYDGRDPGNVRFKGGSSVWGYAWVFSMFGFGAAWLGFSLSCGNRKRLRELAA